jgi:predicted RNA-binding protein with PIN domain
MALHVIVDGYNLIGRSSRYREDRRHAMETARDRLIEDLRRYKRFKGFRITVVFDGSQTEGGGLPGSTTVKGIRILYSRGGQEADDVIVKMVGDAPEGVLVVTSDREVDRHCRAYGATVVSTEDFEEKLVLSEMTELKGGPEDPALDEPKIDTRKKGPARKAPKRSRQDRRRRDRL